MPETEIGTSGAITIPEVNELARPFQLDLIAYFTELQDDSLKLLDKAVKEGWTEQKLESEIIKLTK